MRNCSARGESHRTHTPLGTPPTGVEEVFLSPRKDNGRSAHPGWGGRSGKTFRPSGGVAPGATIPAWGRGVVARWEREGGMGRGYIPSRGRWRETLSHRKERAYRSRWRVFATPKSQYGRSGPIIVISREVASALAWCCPSVGLLTFLGTHAPSVGMGLVSTSRTCAGTVPSMDRELNSCTWAWTSVSGSFFRPLAGRA